MTRGGGGEDLSFETLRGYKEGISAKKNPPYKGGGQAENKINNF